MAINGPMVVGDHEGTVEQFEFVSRTFSDIEAYLTDSEGVINYSTESESVGQSIIRRLDYELLLPLLGKSLTKAEDEGVMLQA